MRFGRVFYIIVLVICTFEFVRLWNITPPQMAAHFNVQGNPDRFVPKSEFFWYQIQTMLVVIVISVLLQILFLFAGFINMPRREYWLAPERRTEIVGHLNSFGAFLFSLILLVIQAAFELAVYANLQTPIMFKAQWMLVVMIVFFILIGLLLIQLVISFRRPVSNE